MTAGTFKLTAIMPSHEPQHCKAISQHATTMRQVWPKQTAGYYRAAATAAAGTLAFGPCQPLNASRKLLSEVTEGCLPAASYLPCTAAALAAASATAICCASAALLLFALQILSTLACSARP
jgi:hypothetical protein